MIWCGTIPRHCAVLSRRLPWRCQSGTLTVVTRWLPVEDPVLAWGIADLPALSVVYDGLVALRKAGGTQGYTLVPDLATRLPLPTDAGRTYTFALRPGIRYSSGTPVRASDFRRGIQRQLAIGANPAYYTGIIGTQQCQAQPRHCQLSAGIAADDAAGTVTFRLTRADPDFCTNSHCCWPCRHRPALPTGPPSRPEPART
jgi:ABC-type transport system substrate-binding protein